MTRRSALTAVGSLMAGIMGNWGSKQGTTTQSSILRILDPPTDLSMSFGQLKAVHFQYGDRKVTVTPKEIMDALEGK